MDKIERAFIKSEMYKRALNDYRIASEKLDWDESELGDFLSELFRESDGGLVKASEIHELHTQWASINEKPTLSQKSLGTKLRKVLRSKRMTAGIYYLGIEVKGFDRPIYQLFSKETNETDGEYYNLDGLIRFVQGYWLHLHEGQELPDHLKDMALPEVKKELGDIGVRVESIDDRFGFIT